MQRNWTATQRSDNIIYEMHNGELFVRDFLFHSAGRSYGVHWITDSCQNTWILSLCTQLISPVPSSASFLFSLLLFLFRFNWNVCIKIINFSVCVCVCFCWLVGRLWPLCRVRITLEPVSVSNDSSIFNLKGNEVTVVLLNAHRRLSHEASKPTIAKIEECEYWNVRLRWLRVIHTLSVWFAVRIEQSLRMRASIFWLYQLAHWMLHRKSNLCKSMFSFHFANVYTPEMCVVPFGEPSTWTCQLDPLFGHCNKKWHATIFVCRA